MWQQFSRLNPSVYRPSAALRGDCWYCMISRFDCSCNKRRLLLLLLFKGHLHRRLLRLRPLKQRFHDAIDYLVFNVEL